MSHLARACVVLSVGILALDLAAQPIGTEFRVNTYTTGRQHLSSIASRAGGGWVVVWTGPDGDGDGVFGQRYNIQGDPVGGEFRVNTYTTGFQSGSGLGGPSVASDGSGDFVVVWTERNGLYPYAIVGRRYTNPGTPLGPEFHVNASTQQTVRYPNVARVPTGSFVVAWQFDPGDGSDDNIRARRFDAAGAPLDSPFDVNTFTTARQIRPKVAAAGSGFVVTWASYGHANDDSTGVYAQRFDAGGAPLGTEHHVNSYTTGYDDSPDVAMASDGTFVIVWRGVDQDGSADGIRARIYDASGAPLSSGFRVNTYTTSSQSVPRVAFDPNHNFLVVWESFPQDGSAIGIYGQRFSSAGDALGSEMRVSSSTTVNRYDAVVAASALGGRYLAAFMGGDGSTDDIYARTICLLGDANADGQVSVSDVFYMINYLFAGGSTPPTALCADVNGDGKLDVADVFYLINYLFAGGPPPV
jgi:hypothetical protein